MAGVDKRLRIHFLGASSITCERPGPGELGDSLVVRLGSEAIVGSLIETRVTTFAQENLPG